MQNTYTEEKRASSRNAVEKRGIYLQYNEIGPNLLLFTKIRSKGIKDHILNLKTVETLEENIGSLFTSYNTVGPHEA